MSKVVRVRGLLAAALLVAVAEPGFAQSPCQTGVRSAERCAEIAAAESLLARGEAAAATLAYERLAALEHAVDIEIGIVRSQLQAGQFRRALAFAAHTAGAHGDDTSGAALYARLLERGGYPDHAARVLAQASARGSLAGSGGSAPHAPYAFGDVPAPHAVLAATGVLIDSGQRAVAPARAVAMASRVWVRDGLGRTVEARIRREHSLPELAVLDLERPLGTPRDVAVAAQRPAFPGAPAYVMAFAADSTGPAWPWLKTGFVGMPDATDARPRLNVDALTGLATGGPVFDVTGQLIGLALEDERGERRMLPASTWMPTLTNTRPVSAAATTRLAPDALYEQALVSTLQVLVQR